MLSIFNVIALSILVFTLYFWFLKTNKEFKGSILGAFGLLVVIAIFNALASFLGGFMAAFGPKEFGEVIPIFASAPITAVAFYLLFYNLISSRNSLVVAATLFALFSNFYFAFIFTTFLFPASL